MAATVVAASGWTWAAARIGLGQLLTGSVTLSAVALLCCAVAPAYWLVVACAVLFGLSSGAIDAALAVGPVYPLLVLTTHERTTATSADRLVGFQAAASTLGAVTCPIAVGLIMSADPATFASCLLVLALLSAVGIWALQPGRLRPPVISSR